MKLYHVSYDKIDSFKLRIPDSRIPGEDAITPRICFSSSVTDCINAKPGQATALKIAQDAELPLAIYVYEIDRSEYERDKELISPITLYRSYGLKDAINNLEYWLLTEPKSITENRYEISDAIIKKGKAIQGYPVVVSLSLTEQESLEARALEYLTEKARSIVPDVTTDLLLLAYKNKLKKVIAATKRSMTFASCVDNNK